MPKLLRAVRLDDSDEHVFRSCGAAQDGEWVTTAGFAVRDALSQDSFMAIASPARCTIAEVVEVGEPEVEAQIEAFAWTLVKAWHAPSWAAARALAEEEVRHTLDVCETLAPQLWITVKRTRRDDGTLDERYSAYDRLLIGAHS